AGEGDAEVLVLAPDERVVARRAGRVRRVRTGRMSEIRNPRGHDFDFGARAVDRKRRAVEIAAMLPERRRQRRRVGYVHEPVARYAGPAKDIGDLRVETLVEPADVHM